MRQRNKVLETDSPTAKFLYTILKQLDLKSIDWNRVASDLEVSNGHAARMRYSRFRQQMEGTTGQARTKRKSKKDKNIEPPTHAQGIFPMAPPLMMPMDTVDSSLQSNPFVKHEPGTQGSTNLQSFMQYPSQSESTTTQGQYYVPQDFASTQFQLVSNMPSWQPSPSPGMPSFMDFYQSYQSPTVSTSYPYSSPGLPIGFDMSEFETAYATPNLTPTNPWESRFPYRQQGRIVKVEEEQHSLEEAPSSEGQPVCLKSDQIQPDQIQLGQSQPGSDESGPNESGPNESGPNEPGPNQPGPNQPGPNQPGPSQPGPSQPGPSQPGSSQPKQSQSVQIRSDPSLPEKSPDKGPDQNLRCQGQSGHDHQQDRDVAIKFGMLQD